MSESVLIIHGLYYFGYIGNEVLRGICMIMHDGEAYGMWALLGLWAL